MPRTTRIAPATAVAALVCLTATPASAQNSDVQFWSQASAVVKLDRSVTASGDFSYRWREAAVGGDAWLARLSLDLTVARHVAIGGGLTYAGSSGPGETRPHQQVNLTFGGLSLRTRLEERFVDRAARMGLRLRERVQYRVPLGKSDRLIGSVEALYNLRQTDPLRRPGLQEWRFQLGAQRQLAKSIDLTAAYMLIDAKRPALADRITHVPMLTLTWHG